MSQCFFSDRPSILPRREAPRDREISRRPQVPHGLDRGLHRGVGGAGAAPRGQRVRSTQSQSGTTIDFGIDLINSVITVSRQKK